VLFEVASTVVPITKLGTAAKAADKIGDVARGLDKLDDVADVARITDTLGDIGKQLDNARSAGGLSAALKAGRFTPESLTLLAKAGKLTATEISEVVTHLGVKTPRDQLVLWSGLGEKGEVRAAAFAKEAGGMTLEMTKGGKWLNDLKLFENGVTNITKSEAYTIWLNASKSVAEQASGQVRVAAGTIKPESVFAKVERPALLNNSNVLGIDIVQLKPSLGIR
jgi:hypothetical protein